MQPQADENPVLTETETVSDVNTDPGEEQMVQISDDRPLNQGCTPNQVGSDRPVTKEAPAEDSTSATASPGPSDDSSETLQTPRWPVRERRAPRIFTYDKLGKQACYSIGPPAHLPYLHQVLPHEHHMAGPQWRNAVPFLHHQPVLLHGY